jgi:hypothetical protein
MELKLNITTGQTITVIAFVCIAFASGFFLAPQQNNTSNNGFDLNTIAELNYFSGHCERLGLESNVLIQDLNGIPYGLPICTEKHWGEVNE